MGNSTSTTAANDVQETLLDITPESTPKNASTTATNGIFPFLKRRRTTHYLFLDVQTTGEDDPQLVNVDAVMYSPTDGILVKHDWMSALVKPCRGYSAMQHMQDVRAHGIPLDILLAKGQAPSTVVGQLVEMVESLDTGRVVVVGHGVDGMMANFLAAARVDEALSSYWDALETLCQDTHDTIDDALRAYPDRANCGVASILTLLGQPLPENRAQAVADVYFALTTPQ